MSRLRTSRSIAASDTPNSRSIVRIASSSDRGRRAESPAPAAAPYPRDRPGRPSVPGLGGTVQAPLGMARVGELIAPLRTIRGLRAPGGPLQLLLVQRSRLHLSGKEESVLTSQSSTQRGLTGKTG